MTEREAFAQLKEDALKGREIRKDKSENTFKEGGTIE